MLQRLRNRDRRDWHDAPDWPERRDDYGHVEPVTDTYRDYPDHFARRRERRPAGRRVALTLFTAIVFAGIAGAVYFAAGGGTVDALLARVQGFIPASAAVDTNLDAQTTQPGAVPGQQASSPAAQPTAAAAPAPAIPSVEGLVILIRNAIVALHQANLAGNYSVLRDMAAPDFQAANSPADLSQIFADLRASSVDLGAVVAVNPRLVAEPVIDEQGLLRLAGFFATGAMEADFDLLFQPLDGRWRLFGIGLAPRPPADGADATAVAAPAPVAAGTIPDAPTLVALIRGAVIALNQANLTGNYSVLRDLSAPGFRQANDLTALATIFAELRGRQLDLAPVAVIDPQLFRPPALDKDGFLRLTGFFPSRPEQVNFDLAYQFVDGGWRLFGLGVNTSREAPADSVAAAPAGSGAPGPASNGAPAANDNGAAAEQPPSAPAQAVGPPPVPRLRPGAATTPAATPAPTP